MELLFEQGAQISKLKNQISLQQSGFSIEKD